MRAAKRSTSLKNKSDSRPASSRSRHGTARKPGADLSRLPIGIDLRAVRMAEGVRAALACAVVILASELLHQPLLIYMALAAFFTCLCDIGGPIRQRVPMLLSFTVLGAVIWCVFGMLRGVSLPLAVGLAILGIFCNSFARVWGTGATAVGNILSIVLILSLDEPLAPAHALSVGIMFLAGGLWATLLTMVVWRLHPYKPARDAVSEVWRQLADLTRDLLDLTRRDQVVVAEWEAHARAHRRAVREEIEYARTIVLDLVGMRGRLSARGSQALLRLEAGDQLFGTLIALSDLLETGTPERRQAAVDMLRLLKPMLKVLARSMQSDTAVDPDKLDRAIAKALYAASGDPVLARIAKDMADRLLVATKLSTPEGYLPGGPIAGVASQPWADRLLAPIRANLTTNSAMLRHALRTAVIAAPALAVTVMYEGHFSHWLPITVVVTLQPFYAATWQRALERVGGTVLGGLIGALLALTTSSPLLLAMLLFPICIFAFAARQVSFAVFIAGITPLVVVLMELVHAGTSSWEIAGLRALFTVMGGALAVIGWLALWPSWEPDRLKREITGALAGHGDFAQAVVSELLGEGEPVQTEGARRRAGMSTNNLEASIARALQEPGRSNRAQLEAAMVVDSTLRRIAGRLSALRHDAALRASLDAEGWRQWRGWLSAVLTGLGEGTGTATPRPDAQGAEPLARIARQIEMLDGAMRRFRTVEPG